MCKYHYYLTQYDYYFHYCQNKIFYVKGVPGENGWLNWRGNEFFKFKIMQVFLYTYINNRGWKPLVNKCVSKPNLRMQLWL